MDVRHLLLAGALLGAAGCAGDPADRPTEFHYLHATIIEPYCATIGCHSNATQQSHPGVMPLDLSEPDLAYKNLTGVDCGTATLQNITNYVCQAPDMLCLTTPRGDSDLQLRLEGFGPLPYPQMPADVPLPDAEQKLIFQWIDEAVPCEP